MKSSEPFPRVGRPSAMATAVSPQGRAGAAPVPGFLPAPPPLQVSQESAPAPALTGLRVPVLQPVGLIWL